MSNDHHGHDHGDGGPPWMQKFVFVFGLALAIGIVGLAILYRLGWRP